MQSVNEYSDKGMTVVRIAFCVAFFCFGFVATATAASPDARDGGDHRLVVFLDPDQPFEIAANVPEKKEPDKSLMGEERIPSEEEEEAPPVFEEPGDEPETVEDENELPPSAEDEYLPETRPKAKAKAKTYKKRKKAIGRKHKKKRARHRAKRKSNATHRIGRRSRSKTKRATRRFRWSTLRRSARVVRDRRGYAAVGGPKNRYSGHSKKRKSSKSYYRGSSYRSRRLHEYRAYTSHIMPFGY